MASQDEEAEIAYHRDMILAHRPQGVPVSPPPPYPQSPYEKGWWLAYQQQPPLPPRRRSLITRNGFAFPIGVVLIVLAISSGTATGFGSFTLPIQIMLAVGAALILFTVIRR
jgi:hypothetical protein